MRLIKRTLDQIDSPISETYALLDHHRPAQPLLNLAQAAPSYPPPPEIVDRIAAAAKQPDAAAYVGTAGLDPLRHAFAAEMSLAYNSSIDPANVLVTAGCNQAFCVATMAVAAPGDEVIVPLPYYFNHDMWLRMEGITPVYLEPGADWRPDPEAARRAVTPRTRAILLVTPGNPSGVTVAPDTIAAFAAIAAEHDITLIIDETYRNFRDTTDPAHTLFSDPAWGEKVVSLFSFSKDFAIPGYRVGALVASTELIREAMKVLDCVQICAPRIGQEAALAGLLHATAWRQAKALEVSRKRAAFQEVMAARPGGFELAACGAYFGWIRHPFATRPAKDVVRELLFSHDMLLIPGTAFLPDDRRMIRASIANLSLDGIGEFARRLASAGA
jgi:aspartate/methionine/tyrosine aminotransferase